MWTNGSRAALLTPAKARPTGNPSPSWPGGPVVIERTGRSVSDTPATVTRATRDKANVSAVIAGICSLLVLWIPAITGPQSDYSAQPFLRADFAADFSADHNARMSRTGSRAPRRGS